MAKMMAQRKRRWKMMLHHPHHLMVFQIIAFHNTFYSNMKAIIALYVKIKSNTT